MHFGDSIFIFLLALVLFGPKKLPEIGRQVGKLLAEFRRASNEFKFQIQEELRAMEDEERRKKLAETQALAAATATPALTTDVVTPESAAEPAILPPETGLPVSTDPPYAEPASPTEFEPVRAAEFETPAAEISAETFEPETFEPEPLVAAESAASEPTSAEPPVEPPHTPVKEISVHEPAQAAHHG